MILHEEILNLGRVMWQMTTVMLFCIFIIFYFSKKKHIFRKLFILTAIFYQIIYLIWRTKYTVPLHSGYISLFFGGLLLSSEWIGFLRSLVFNLLFWEPYKNKFVSIDEFDSLPTVDVLITTYNESTEILKKTLAACLNINYPKNLMKIYLCDDGRREEVRELCNEWGVNYITRRDNKHAKAGNVNNALKKTNGKFIALFDSDMVPKSNFLKKTLGYFTDSNVGFVQTPQAFYNPDPFQFNLKFNNRIPNEQDFFMRNIQQERARFNAVLHVGTNAVFRRKAIDEIGGIPTGTITEDMATGMLIQSKGYSGIFINDILATGLSAEKFSELLKQRERWCRGNIQASKKWNPLTVKGLSILQRIIYFDGLVYWFFGVQKMIYIICPLMYLIFGVSILQASMKEFILFWLPSYATSFLTFRFLAGNTRNFTWSHIYETAMAPYLAVASMVELIFEKSIPFRVTPKGIHSNKINFSQSAAIPHLILLLLTVLAWIITMQKFPSENVSLIDSVNISMGWSIYNLIGIVMSIFLCFERPRFRNSERLTSKENLLIQLEDESNLLCTMKDISESGLRLECSVSDDINLKNKKIGIKFNGIKTIKGEVVWVKGQNKHVEFGIKFNNISKEQYLNIVKYISNRSEGYYAIENNVSSLKKLIFNLGKLIENYRKLSYLRKIRKLKYLNRDFLSLM